MALLDYFWNAIKFKGIQLDKDKYIHTERKTVGPDVKW